jgi:predicted DNA-binding protein (UPF0251 family)
LQYSRIAFGKFFSVNQSERLHLPKKMGITQQAVSRPVSKAEKKLGLGVVKQAA